MCVRLFFVNIVYDNTNLFAFDEKKFLTFLSEFLQAVQYSTAHIELFANKYL